MLSHNKKTPIKYHLLHTTRLKVKNNEYEIGVSWNLSYERIERYWLVSVSDDHSYVGAFAMRFRMDQLLISYSHGLDAVEKAS